jgi:hypothetical protein
MLGEQLETMVISELDYVPLCLLREVTGCAIGQP